MALPGGFGLLTPVGLLAIAAVVPVIVLYLVQPDPRRVAVPTVRFLLDADERDTSHPLLERLRRSVLLLLQLAVIVALATALATPYVAVAERDVVEETVLVVDASASMATESDGDTRFDRAIAAARDDVTGTTSVVVAGGDAGVALRRGSGADARATLDGLAVAETEASLRTAISEASAIAGDDARIVVYSDFAGDTAWEETVQSARARGAIVDLEQFAGGGEDNVGLVERSFSGQNVTFTVGNFGEGRAERTLALGDQRRELDLAPGELATVGFRVPAGGGEARLTPGDSLPVDDVAYVAAPADQAIDVLLVTNDENRYLSTALSVIDAVNLDVAAPPTSVSAEYDVVVYSNVDGERLLQGTVEAGRDTLENGGGVAVQAQPSMPERYGDLSLLEPSTTRRNPTLAPTAEHDLTRDVAFPPPEEFVAGDLRAGRALVETNDGTPLLATANEGGGRLLYYGYLADASSFKFNYQYPVFWKRAVYHLAGREPVGDLNRATGERLRFDEETAVETPDGTVRTTSLALADAGYYAVGDRQLGVSLYSDRESAARAEPLDADGTDDSGVATREETRQVPRPLTGLLALVAVALAIGEVAYLRRRGDL